MISKELINHFERLRIARGGLSQLDFIEGIISITQYRRYLKGDSKLPFRVIVELSNRLGLKYDYVLDQIDVSMECPHFFKQF
jgi:transcriptional regulator with XRE-family HTH domain